MPPPPFARPLRVVLMGVSGTGKTVVGQRLATRLGGEFLDADDFHPASNITKMRGGIPLDDTDRAPWLDILATALADRRDTAAPVILACSALRRTYRDRLRAGAPQAVFVVLEADRETVAQRVGARGGGHFMPVTLVESQFAALEPLAGDENGFTVDATRPSDAVADTIARRLSGA